MPMKQTFLAKAAELLRDNMRRKRWYRVCTGLAAAVVFVTTYMLILPAITMESETICGMAEHTHTDDCYELRLVCTQEETPEGADVHVHGPECYEQQQVLTCTQQEGEGHTHTDACYGYVCGQEESAGHTHTDACYTEVTNRELTCTEPESAGHTHGDGCYDEEGNLTCSESESAGHTHSDSCYTETVSRELTCGQEESAGHTHSDACIGLICGQEESEGHTHTEACYTTEDVLICTQSTGHTHGDGCYEKVLICEIPEHTHTEECYPAPEEPEVPEEPELICTVPEHSHAEACYDADGNVICGMEEHTHTDECYAVVEEIPEEELPLTAFPEEIPEGYVEYTFDNEAGLTVTAYAPDGAFGQDVQLFAEVLPEDSEGYAQAKENLDNAENAPEYTGMAAMDIRFVDAVAEDPASAEEIEPDAEMGQIFVKIDAQALLPEDVDECTLAVQHHAKVSDGGIFGTGIFEHTDVVVETVADISEETGDITAVPDETALPETLPALADEPETEEAATLEEPAAETEETQPAAMNVEAKFAVESFSKFTITWTEGRQKQQVTVYYVDTNGYAIDGGNYQSHNPTFQATFNNNSWVSMTWYADTINNYQYQYARLNNATSGTIISQLYYGDNTWKYKVPGSDEEYTLPYSYYKPTVYLVYKSGTGVSQFTTAKTVDHIEKGVHMYMFDYGTRDDDVTALFGSGSDQGAYYYGDGTTKEGMLNALTNTNGWPTMQVKVGTTAAGSSFASVFAKNNIGTNALAPTSGAAVYEVNNLFLKDAYDHNGDFYFNSAEYFATLDDGDGKNFTVYNQLGTPKDDNYFFYQRGNFMPYNTLTKKIANYNLYNDDGTLKTEEDHRLGEPVYETNGTNYQFGMYMFANFYQPENGQVETSTGTKEDMIFEFTGDDDMWVFIDGVLVLDIGGVHDAQSGYINFTDGTVNWTDTPKSSTSYGNNSYAYPTSEVIWHNPDSASSTTDTPTTLKDIYTKVGKYEKFDWNGNTFQDGSTHTIQVFYMERGSGASNLKMRFNLKTIPDGTLAVTKDVDNYYSGQMKNLEYTMQVKVDGAAYSDKEYYILGQESQKFKTNPNGCFNLKHDQTAIFEGIKVGKKVEVEEVGMPSLPEGVSLDDQYDVAYVVKDAAGNLMQGENVEMPGYGSVNVTVTNTAKFTRPLVVKKVFEGTNGQTPEDFEATFSLYEVTEDGDKLIDTVKYSEFTDGQFVFWLETDKTYKVTETFGDGDNTGATETLAYAGNSVSDTDSSNAAGVIALDVADSTKITNAETITITNRYGEPSADLTIVKYIYGLTDEEVVKLINGDYRKMNSETADESGLRFDVDVFDEQDHLTSDEAGHDVPSNWGVTHPGSDDWNIRDWTFNVDNTLMVLDSKNWQNAFNNADQTWAGYISFDDREKPGDPSIAEADVSHYQKSSLKKENGYYVYTVTIEDVELSKWYRVWELHMDVPGYDLDASVETTGAITIFNETTNHDGRASAFQLTGDTTVTFTNRYEQDQLDLTKNVTVSGVLQNTGDTEFTFNLKIPAEWGNTPTEYNTGIYNVTYTRADDTSTTDVDETTVIHKAGIIQFDASGTYTGLKLYAGETAHIKLPADIQVTITETGYDGYAVNWTVGNGQTLVNNSEGSVTVTLPGGQNVTCTNTTGAVLPSTGGMGTTPFLALGSLCTLSAGLLLLAQRRRKGGSAAA